MSDRRWRTDWENAANSDLELEYDSDDDIDLQEISKEYSDDDIFYQVAHETLSGGFDDSEENFDLGPISTFASIEDDSFDDFGR